MPINKILIANRGEIAVRILRTAQALGYETVAIFSEVDAEAPHVNLADQAVRLGPAEVDQSYLNSERILAAAEKSGADAIHPGYGFLSENPPFAQQVIEAGLTWIGPPPTAMEIMGNKAAAKRAIADTTVPCVSGYDGADQSDEMLISAAESIGYPVMVKASAGGGGRGMRLVEQSDALPAALANARSEALKAFGSDELLLEKAIINPRHIEVQIFGDTHGNIIHLGERDCSIQRRHQKVVEEAPSPAVSAELRTQLGQAAVDVAKAVDYYGAGTVEFLLDETGQFYFIEMNTRLQVEHPVTEMITGLDLVAWQLLVAEGEPLPLKQGDIDLTGHAIEVRLYAEDPQNGFLPSTGQIYSWHPPQGEGVRVDHGLDAGMAITPYYDAMIAKLITRGETRAIACRRLRRALQQTVIFGVETNRQFLLETIDHPIFAAGEATTAFIEQHWQVETTSSTLDNTAYLSSLAAMILYHQASETMLQPLGHHWNSRPTTYRFRQNETEQLVTIQPNASQTYLIETMNRPITLKPLRWAHNSLHFEHDGLQDTAYFARGAEGELWLQYGPQTVTFTDTLLSPPDTNDATDSGNILSPMPGSVMRLDVAVGQTVKKGDTLLILEAMKMEHTIVAPFDGIVEQILVEAGQQMTPKALMVVLGD
ncbi:MAG: acetyl/propionyl/methylcrotonyl-CoA carboxylase subunit alpha [Chloroflexota bacterium]